jgi:hypothetical protein
LSPVFFSRLFAGKISSFGKSFVKHIVNVAIAPIFARLKGFDNRVIARVKMFCRVFIRGIVAAADVPARFAKPEMNPAASGFQTIFAAVGARRHRFDFAQMLAFIHKFLK